VYLAGSRTPTMAWLPTTSTGRSALRTARAADAIESVAVRSDGSLTSGRSSSGRTGALNWRYRWPFTYSSSARAARPLPFPSPTSFAYIWRTISSG